MYMLRYAIRINRLFVNDNESSIVERISRRISDATHLDVKRSEPLQVQQLKSV